jgi:hypothetical protein
MGDLNEIIADEFKDGKSMRVLSIEHNRSLEEIEKAIREVMIERTKCRS